MTGGRIVSWLCIPVTVIFIVIVFSFILILILIIIVVVVAVGVGVTLFIPDRPSQTITGHHSYTPAKRPSPRLDPSTRYCIPRLG